MPPARARCRRAARFEPDAVTREVIALVEQRFPQHPGRLASFAWPVTRAQALQSLHAFVQERLPLFGRYQDAMWPGDPWLYHAHLSAALNLKLLNPREVVAAAVAAYDAGHAPLASVEGFVRQILGWREYVRGIYWTQMPGYLERNTLGADADLPDWYWTGATDMACLRDAIEQTLTHGYANHIQRLMVTGLYALMLGVQPRQVHAWYLAVYVDAVEWVELPNTLGMSQYADGGLMGSKPYVATGKYIERMSPHCKGCRYDPAQRTGESACPFTTLYWDFLMRHEATLAKNPRMALQVKNLARMNASAAAGRGRAGGSDPPRRGRGGGAWLSPAGPPWPSTRCLHDDRSRARRPDAPAHRAVRRRVPAVPARDRRLSRPAIQRAGVLRRRQRRRAGLAARHDARATAGAFPCARYRWPAAQRRAGLPGPVGCAARLALAGPCRPLAGCGLGDGARLSAVPARAAGVAAMGHSP